MAQVQFDRCWLHSIGTGEEKVTSILLYNKPSGTRARRIKNVRVYKVVRLIEFTWNKSLGKCEVRLMVQAEPHAHDSNLVFTCAQWRKEFPMGGGKATVGQGGSVDDEQGRHFDFGPQDPDIQVAYKRHPNEGFPWCHEQVWGPDRYKPDHAMYFLLSRCLLAVEVHDVGSNIFIHRGCFVKGYSSATTFSCLRTSSPG